MNQICRLRAHLSTAASDSGIPLAAPKAVIQTGDAGEIQSNE
jgi:hypothetical protein